MKFLSDFLKALAITLLLFFGLKANAQTVTDNKNIDDFIKKEKISDRVLLIKTGVFYFDAITAIATQKGIVVIDAGYSPTLTKKYKTIIENEFKRDDFAYVIDTHSHWDHTNGNKIFPKAVVIGHNNCKSEMINKYSDRTAQLGFLSKNINQLNEMIHTSDMNSEYGQQLAYRVNLFSMVLADLEKDYTFRYPTLTFSDSLSIDMGDITLNLIFFGKAHSVSDIVIYIPEEKLLMAGDLFNKGGGGNLSELNHGNVKKSDINRWHETLNYLLGPNIEFERIIDGHAAMLTRTDLIAFNKNVGSLWNEFNSGREISARIKLNETLKNAGLEAMVAEYKSWKTDNDKYYFFESELSDFGYHLLKNNEINAAIEIFKIIVEKFPSSWNAYDSLGEAYLKSGDTELSKANYEKSLSLNENNDNAKKMLQQLNGK